MKVRVLFDKLLVSRSKDTETTASGLLYKPIGAQEKQNRGEVIAIGGGRISDNGTVTPITVQVGDVVLFGKFAGDDIEVEGDSFVIIAETDILAVIKP